MKQLARLKDIIAKLRSPQGCPWDREQTHDSLRPLLLEEVHEALDALSSKDMLHFQEELGDILLHIFLHAQIASEDNLFDIEAIARGISDKLIRRHPHVFGDLKVAGMEEVSINWEEIKKKEKSSREDSNPFSNIPKAMGALAKSSKLGKQASKFRFDWENPKEIKNKIIEEINEMEHAMAVGKSGDFHNMHNIKEEFGDLLFSLCQWARHNNIDAEDALLLSNQKFEKRFTAMLKTFQKQENKNSDEFQAISPEKKEYYWEQVKREQDY